MKNYYYKYEYYVVNNCKRLYCIKQFKTKKEALQFIEEKNNELTNIFKDKNIKLEDKSNLSYYHLEKEITKKYKKMC